jgi:hypothetical protein
MARNKETTMATRTQIENLLVHTGRTLRGRTWHYEGASPARYGWAAVTPAGDTRYLGRTLEEAHATLLAPTDTEIEALRYEAGCAGDTEQVAICDRALQGNDAARAECARVIADAQAMDDGDDGDDPMTRVTRTFNSGDLVNE